MTALVKHINSPGRSIELSEYAALHNSITLLKDELSKINAEIKNIHQETPNKHFLIPSNNGYKYVSSDEIVYCQADGNYTTIYLIDGSTCLVSKTLKRISELLHTGAYIRCHQSYLLNKKYVRQIVGSTCEIKSDNHHLNLPISRRKLSDVINAIGTLF